MIKRLLLLTLLSIAVLLIGKFEVKAQYLWVDANFDGYIGTPATVPSGLFISWNSVSPASFYTSAGNFGVTAPSYKFGNDSNYFVTTSIINVDSITFWMKGNGAPFSPANELRFYSSPDSLNYTLFETMDSLPTSGTNISLPVNQFTGNIKIEYHKAAGGGNLAFDDLKIYASAVVGVNEVKQSDPVTVYPSPSTGIVNIKTTLGSVPPFVEVFDIIGNKIYSGQPVRTNTELFSIDLSNKTKGFYFLKIRNGKEVFTKRITLIN